MQITREEARYNVACLRHRLQSQARQPARVLVNGTPKTGTTWMQRLLTSVPLYRPIGNFLGDLSRYPSLSPGDVVHSHDRYTPELAAILEKHHFKVILMVRDPRDQAVSRMFHIRRDATNPFREQILPLTKEEALMLSIEGGIRSADGRLLVGIDAWLRQTRQWLDAGPLVHSVRYEDLLEDTTLYFGRVLAWLGIPAAPALVESIVRRNVFERLAMGHRIWQPVRARGSENASSHFRKGIRGDWRNHFTPQHVIRFKELTGTALVDLGYEDNLDW
jgi:hypothetical protein